MGFVKPTLPDVDFEEFVRMPLMERIRIMTTKWADHGLGAPRMIHVLYIVKLIFFYALGGVLVATTTSHLPAFWHVSEWWNQPIVYQKLVLWTILLELIGLAGSWGPLAGKTKPMTGGYRFWAKVNTIRLRPWKAVPFTNGDRRTWFDVIVYLALNLSVVVALVMPGVHSDSLSKVLPNNTSGLVNPALLIVPMVLLVLIGLRDETIFLAARGEQYLPALVFFATLPFVSNNIAGNWIGVCIRAGAMNETFTVTDSARNTYRKAFQFNQTTDGDTVALFYAENIASGANAVTVSETTTSTLRFAILEYSGVATSGSLDVTAMAQGYNASPNSGNAVTTVSGDLLLGVITTSDPEAYTAGSGYRMEENVPAEPGTKLITEDQTQASAGAVSASATLGAADMWAAGLAAFKAANSGGPVHSADGSNCTPWPPSVQSPLRHDRSSELSRQARVSCNVPRTSARPPVASTPIRSATSARNVATMCGQKGATQAR